MSELGAPVMGKVIAMQSTGWHVIIEFDEDDRRTHATATARVRENRPMTARGDAYRNPSDSNQPLVGEEIAAARALIDLGRSCCRLPPRIEQASPSSPLIWSAETRRRLPAR